MGFLEIVTLVASLASLAMGVGVAIWAAANKPSEQRAEQGAFSGPRSAFGDVIPIVVGTVQVDSPLVIYASPVFAGKPFAWGWPTRVTDELGSASRKYYFGPDDPNVDANGERQMRITDAGAKQEQYRVSLDLLLTERIRDSLGNAIGTCTLGAIWVGDRKLWQGWGFGGVSGNTDLLSADPNVNTAESARTFPGGMQNLLTTGPGWYWGGIVDRTEGGDDGNILGWWAYNHDGTKYTEAFGLEAIRFYNGTLAAQNAWIRKLIYGDLPAANENYPRYDKFVRLVFEDFCWGVTTSLDRISAEIRVSCPAPDIGDASGLMPNQRDVNPVSFLYVLLTSPDFLGGSKIPAVDLTSFSTARATIASEGLGMSYQIRSKAKAADVVEDVLDHIDGILFLHPTTGKITLRLNREATGSIPSFSEKIVVEGGLKNFAKSTWEAAYSQLRLTFTMRNNSANNEYSQNVALAKDSGLISSSGVTESLDASSATVYDPTVATKLASRKLGLANSPLISFEVEFTRQYEAGNTVLDLLPGDVFNFSYGPLGLKNLKCKVLSINYGELADNRVRIKVIQDRYIPAPNVAPPVPTIGPPVVNKPNAQIDVYRVETAPYPIARIGLGGDARKVLTTSGMFGNGVSSVYPVANGINLDRFLFLAKAPYSGAGTFSVQIANSTGEVVETLLDVPYTPCGVLGTNINPADTNFGGINATYDQESTTPLTITGLHPGDIGVLKTGDRNDGSNILLIKDEFFLIRTYTVLSSTSIRVDSWCRSLWDSPHLSESSSARRDFIGSGEKVWLLDVPDVAKMGKRMSSPMRSGLCIVTKKSSSPVATPPAQPTGGFVADQYTITIANSDPFRNNIKTKLTSQTLKDRANRMFPRRQCKISWSSGTQSGSGYNVVVISSQTGQTTITVNFNTAAISNYSGCDTTNPREEPPLVRRYSSSIVSNDFEESAPNIDGWSSQIVAPTQGNQEIDYREIVAGVPGTWKTANASDSGSFVLTSLPSSGTYDLEIALYSVPRCGTSTYAHSMRSTPRRMVFTVNRAA
ncbi:tail protein [Caudoviricetes sp.]|nr:tail protein [Caudoviricetes sp.]